MQNRGILGWLAATCFAAVALVGAFTSSCAPRTETISGRAKVVDGDSLEIGDVRIRLHAIDAFEGRQICHRDGSTWDCGSAAAKKLEALVGEGEIDCRKTDIDNYGRTVAICSNGEVDLGAEMVQAGLALAYREFGDDYVDEEDDARAARRGAWSGEFTPPWEQRNSGGVRPSNSSSCRDTGVKGNINRAGERIYHVPGSSSFDETIIDESKGERWFCTEDEARGAGWRAPRRP
jgi:endonuclease YncB( thermonuclease family)